MLTIAFMIAVLRYSIDIIIPFFTKKTIGGITLLSHTPPCFIGVLLVQNRFAFYPVYRSFLYTVITYPPLIALIQVGGGYIPPHYYMRNVSS